ncbi:MAG: hypothetical protein V4577_07440 [Bacteroidota bacterium]
MNFFKRKLQQPDEAGDRLARIIADQILRWQNLLAAKMNKGISRYSKKRQQWLLLIFCGVSAISLVICLIVPFGRMAMKMQARNYQPGHIGSPSYLPTNPTHLKSIDSLTTKK